MQLYVILTYNSGMTTYYSSFSSGLQEIVQQALPQLLSDVRIQLLLDGLVVYESDRPLQHIKNIRFFNNTFLLVHLFKNLPDSGLQFMMQALMKKPDLVNVPRWALKGATSYRLMASRENQTVAINRSLLERLESFFSHKLALRVNRSKADMELWFLERSERYGFVGLRLTRGTPSEKTLQKGELRPELTNILCLLSEPAKTDSFLDPFAGSGAIPMERAHSFPFQRITASDHDPAVVANLRKRISVSSKISVEKWDALHLSAIADQTLDKLVTDPPWGFYDAQSTTDLQDFYTNMLVEFSRVLKIGGVLVVLMGQKERFESALSVQSELQLLGKWDILVSGKKAAIYKIKKKRVVTEIP